MAARAIQNFLVEATQELVYNIVHDKYSTGEIGYLQLSKEFEENAGFQPMQFFGSGNFTDYGWFEFLRRTPGLTLDEGDISIDDELWTHYEEYNLDYLPKTLTTVAECRGNLLVQACEVIANDGLGWLENLNVNKDPNGNTPLHLVAAMPGIADDEPALLKYLLEAGLDPLRVNNQGINFLHIIAGRLKAEVDEDGDFYFGTENVHPESWQTGHRQALLDLLSEKLSPAQLATLMNASGRNGNTVLHEWVLSTSTLNTSVDDVNIEIATIGSKLLSFGGNLRLPNQAGLDPLHFACHSAVFKFLLQEGAFGRARSIQDETPLMFILKYLVGLASVNTAAFKEIKDFLVRSSVPIMHSSNKAEDVLEHLISSITESKEIRETLWISDIEDVSPLEIVLVCIRFASNWFNNRIHSITVSRWGMFKSNLVALLNQILKAASPNNLRRENKKGQSALHMLLDMSLDETNTASDDSVILESLQVLLQNGADVDAVDANGQTVMDIVRKNAEKMPSFSKKCAAILQPNAKGQKGGLEARFPRVCELVPEMLALTVGKVTRKLRSCPKYHSDTALQLTKDNTNVTTVEKYRYLNQTPIGSGAFSSIYVAIKDEHVDKKSATIDCRAIALKRLEKGKINPDEIKREVQALLSMSTQCENILNCYQSFEDEFFHYLSLDLMDGDLQQFVGNATAKSMMQQSQGSRAKAAQDIINGLVYLHEHDYLHRDLKPGNILYTIEPSLHFKIGDFGLAKNVSSLSAMTSTKGTGVAAMAPGTRCWMAPELVSLRSREHTKESDVFSLGLVLHFLLTFGRHPFVTREEEPAYQIEKKIVDMAMSIDRSLSSEDSNFLKQILAKDPKRRLPVKYLGQHPFLWSEKKKIEFLKAVGDQPEAVNPSVLPDSLLEKLLQETTFGKQFMFMSWDNHLSSLYSEMTTAWRSKKYRTNSVIDLVRFIRNAYAHKEERSPSVKLQLDDNVFVKKFPSLVLEVLAAVQKAGYDDKRSNIIQALNMS